MSLHDVGLAAGAVATGLFIVSYLPMLVRRTGETARRALDEVMAVATAPAILDPGPVLDPAQAS